MQTILQDVFVGAGKQHSCQQLAGLFLREPVCPLQQPADAGKCFFNILASQAWFLAGKTVAPSFAAGLHTEPCAAQHKPAAYDRLSESVWKCEAVTGEHNPPQEDCVRVNLV